MPALSELQNTWQKAIFNEDASLVRSAVEKPAHDSIDVRIGIYTEAYFLRLIEILGKIYPYLKQYLGEHDFDQLAKSYFKSHPSSYQVVRSIGDDLPAFLAATTKHPVYTDLAKLEWTISNAVDLPFADTLSKDTLLEIPQAQWGDLIFVLHPTFQLLSFSTNAMAIYHALSQSEELPAPEAVDKTYCRVWRKALQIYYLSIKPEEATFLEGVMAGKTFESICEELCEFLPEEVVVNFAISQLLKWLEDGLLIQVKLKGAE